MMRKINMGKYFLITSCLVISFCIVGGGIAWLIILGSGNNAANQKPATTFEANKLKPVANTDANQEKKLAGQINVKQINNIIKEERYTLMIGTKYSKDKINKFLDKNIGLLIPDDCSMISYKFSDLNKDGFNEIGIMYEKKVNSDSFLMVSTLRWVKDKIIKDIDAVMRVNDYDNNVEIVTGDIIPGGNPEFSFIQRDTTGKYGSRLKIALLFPKGGFKDFANINAGSEIEVNDFNGDGEFELYTSKISADGTKSLSWCKWEGGSFVEYQSNWQPMNENDSTTENTLQPQSY